MTIFDPLEEDQKKPVIFDPLEQEPNVVAQSPKSLLPLQVKPILPPGMGIESPKTPVGKTMREMVPPDEKETISQGPPGWVEPLKAGMETAGQIGGSIAGATYGPVGAFIGGTGGYAVGKKAHEGLMNVLGIKTSPYQRPDTPKEAISSGITALEEGAMTELLGTAVGKGGAKVITRAKQLLKAPFGESLSTPASQELARIYKEFNIPVSPSDLLPNSKTLSILEGVAGYRPGSGDVMLKKASEKIDALNKARENLIARKSPTDTVETVGLRIRKEAEDILGRYTNAKGQKLSQMVDDFINRVGTKGQFETGQTFGRVMEQDRLTRGENIKTLYSDVKNLLPNKGMDIVELSPETVSIADRLYKEEQSKIGPLQNKEVMGILKSIKQAGTTKLPENVDPIMLERDPGLKALVMEQQGERTTWEGLQQDRAELLERIRLIKQYQKQPTRETRVYAELAEALDKDMEKYAEAQGGDIWISYRKAADASRKMHEVYDKDILRIMDKSPEDILRSVVNRGEVTLLKQIKDAVGDAGLVSLRQGFFKQIIDASTVNGVLSAKKLGVNISRIGNETLTELATPQQRTMLSQIVKTGESVTQRMGGMKTIEFLETLGGTSNERIINAIIQPNNTQNVRLAKRLLSPERMQEIESSALEKVFLMSGTGNYLPISSAKAWARYEAPIKELLTPQKYRAVSDFLKGGINMTRVEALAKNASQTGQVLLGSQIGGQIIRNPLVSGKLIVLPWMLAKIYTNPKATAFMTRALKVQPTSPEGISNFVKALSIAGINAMPEQENKGSRRPITTFEVEQ